MSFEPTRISHPKRIPFLSLRTDGVYEEKNGELLSFLDEKEKPGFTSLIFEMDPDNCHFNRIEIHPLVAESDFFPDVFRIEISQDGKYWEPIIRESGFRRAQKNLASWNFSLTASKYLKFVARLNRRTESGKFRLAFGAFRILISGVGKIEASSEKDRLRVKENVIDERPDYGWSSQVRESPGEEFLVFDLLAIHRIEEIRMLSKNEEETHFPERFTVYYSEDDLAWHQLMEETDFLAEPGTWYRWRFLPINARYLKMIFTQVPAPGRTSFCTEIIEVEFFATADKGDNERAGHSAGPLPYASVLRSGIVRLAVDGESREGVAVQGNDRRLREATTEYKGIVELATDGEDREGVVVQGNDKRLKHATELSYGLTRLARSGEDKAGVVVQGNDERLRLATTESPGIVELAEDGETRAGVVVQGNDRRLRKATQKEYGLVILQEPGESLPDRVITGDDPRLRDATTETKGVVRLARNGEESALAAVQGNDKRLRKATTETYGIVQLARSGESSPGVVVQGDDSRLKMASTESPGIVAFARHGSGEPGKAVLSDDPRLSDRREPLPHSHDYAPKDHDFNSHSGCIHLTRSTASEFKGVFPPNPNHSVIWGRNENKRGAGMSGVGGKEGIIGYGLESGVVGFSEEEQGQGVLGASKSGYGGEFVSHRNYALYANGKGIDSRSLPGSGKSILADGDSRFRGMVQIQNGDYACIAKVFDLDPNDVLGEGDLLVLNSAGKLTKARNPYSTNTVGVLVGGAGILLGDLQATNQQGIVAIAGVVLLNVDPSMGAIQPGDLLVAGLVGGHAIKADPNRIKPGCIVAKALGSKASEKGKIPVLLAIG